VSIDDLAAETGWTAVEQEESVTEDQLSDATEALARRSVEVL